MANFIGWYAAAGHDDVGQAAQRVAIATVLIVQWRLRPALGVCGTARSLQAKIKQQRRGLALTPASSAAITKKSQFTAAIFYRSARAARI